jgi:hypothetical protein
MKPCCHTSRSLLSSLCGLLRQCMRRDEGVAFITFGIFVALIGLLLLAANIDFGRNFGSQTEIRSKLEEYSTLLTQEYNELFDKGSQCARANNEGATADCMVNADKQQRVFGQELNKYFSAGAAKLNDTTVTADMNAYLKKALNDDLGRLRFQSVNTTAVNVTCHDLGGGEQRVLLTFTADAPQFSTFWQGIAGGEIAVEVKRLSRVPCTFADVPNPNPTSCPDCNPTPGPETCFHAPKPRRGAEMQSTDLFFNETNNHETLAANSIVNFVMSLDARSKANMGANSDNLTARFSRSLLSMSGLLADANAIAAGLTIGNFPMAQGDGGQGLNCRSVEGSLSQSGACYDSMGEPAKITRNSARGFQNVSRKTAISGEFRAQHTRRCSPDNAVWTYEPVIRGNCYEESYSAPEIGAGMNAHTWFDVADTTATRSDIAARVSSNDSAWLNANMPERHDTGLHGFLNACRGYNNATREAMAVNTSRGIWVDRNNLQCDSSDRNCRYSMAATCVFRSRSHHDVYSGKWVSACRSAELGNDSFSQNYGDPSELVSFRGKLVGNLDGAALTGAPYEDVILRGTATLADEPNKMRARDAAGLLQVDNELKNLHPKNTERSFVWACDDELQTRNGARVNTNGNLTRAYGDRVGTPILDDNGNPRSSDCSVPVGTKDGERLANTVQTYDITFTRDGCNPGSDSCDIPEGMYALEMAAGSRALQTDLRPTASRLPDGELRTTWIPDAPTLPAEKRKWAWGAIGTASHANLNNECPLANGAVSTPPSPTTTCAPGVPSVRGFDGGQENTYCLDSAKQYRTTFFNNSATCGTDGANCPNIARYILNNPDDSGDVVTNNFLPERLNIGAIAVERRQVQSRVNPSSGVPEPYLCTIDKAETLTGSSRPNYVVAANNGRGTNNLSGKCDWRYPTNGGLFCNSYNGWGTTVALENFVPNQTEQQFIDENNDRGGIFSLTANSLSSAIPIGDAEEEFGNGLSKLNFKPRKYDTINNALLSDLDSSLRILPLQVQNEDAVRYRYSDLPPDNIEIDGGSGHLNAVLSELSRGYEPYEIFNFHRGNQCALIRQGLRSLWTTDTPDAPKSKFLVYIGSLPTQADFSQALVAHQATVKQDNGGIGGTYDPQRLMLKGKAKFTPPETGATGPTSPGATVLKNCLANSIYENDTDRSTTPFIITTASTAAEAETILDTLKSATAQTTNEACKRPYCLLSTKDGVWRGSDGTTYEAENGIMTPETCAAKLWKCISPASTKY